MSLPGHYSFELYEGDSSRLNLQFLEDDGTPVNLMGSKIRLMAKRRITDPEPVIDMFADFPFPERGEFAFAVSPNFTQGVCHKGVKEELFYDMQYTYNSTVITIVYGTLTVLPEVTRP